MQITNRKDVATFKSNDLDVVLVVGCCFKLPVSYDRLKICQDKLRKVIYNNLKIITGRI